MDLTLAIDMGGTKTAVGIFDDKGHKVAEEISTNPKSDDAEVVWQAVADTIEKTLTPYRDDVLSCGIAAAGPARNHYALLSPANTPAWKEFPFASRVSELTGLPTYIENDANALALAEGFVGTAAGEQNFMAMVVSTGIGGGIVVNGRLLHGSGMNAGEIGHVIIDVDGPSCGLGCQGCVEGIASGPSLERKFGISPKDATLEMKQYCADNVAIMLANVVTILDIRLIAIGGSVALGFADVFFDRCNETFLRLAKIPFARGVRIVPSALGADGGLVGAARVGMLGRAGEL